MTKITYDLKEFDKDKAKTGALCVMVKNSVNAGETISTVNPQGDTNSNIIGTGVCKSVSSDCYSLVINSVEYQFNSSGIGNYPSSDGYKLLLGVAQINLSTSGNASKSSSTTITTRADDGSISTKVDYSKSSDILVETLNARDEFAVKALGQMLGHIDNPANLSNTEMNFYCEAAYKWAANMMQASANARGTFEQQTDKDSSTTVTPSTSLTDVPFNTLSSNSEKLLNNLVAILERTDELHVNVDEKTYSKRVTLQFTEFINILNKYLSNGETGLSEKKLGIKDLITAINNTYSGDNLKELVNAIKNINITSSDKVSLGDNGLGNESTNPLFVQSNTQGSISIGSSGLGSDKDHPFYMTGGGFPTRQSLAAALAADAINSMLTFNANGAVGYSTLEEVKKAVLGWINNYKDLDTLYTALDAKVVTTVDARVKAWLNKTTVVSDGSNGYKLNVPSSI